jgi:hypothetical protein
MLLGLKVLIESYDILVPSLFENHNFLHHFLGLTVILEMGRVDGLDCYHLLGKHLHRYIYFSKGARPSHFTDPVELHGSWWALFGQLKCFPDVVHKFLVHFLFI